MVAFGTDVHDVAYRCAVAFAWSPFATLHWVCAALYEALKADLDTV